MSTKPSPATPPPAGAASASGPSQTTTPTPQFSCAMCDSKETKTCAGCKSTAYCGKTCQKEDWPCHKLLCSALATSKLETERPSDSIRAVLFPADGDKPVLHYFPRVRGWVEGLYDDIDELFDRHEKPEIVAEVNRRLDEAEEHHGLAPMADVDTNKVRGHRATENSIEVWWRAHANSNVNRAVTTAITGSWARHHTWRGSLVMIAMTYARHENGERTEQTYKDMTLRDFRDAVDWLADFGNPQRKRDEFRAAMRLAQMEEAERELKKLEGEGGDEDAFYLQDDFDPDDLDFEGGHEAQMVDGVSWDDYYRDYMSL